MLTIDLQSELEYDPVMYQRDRGELDWDQRSIASSNMLSDAGTLQHQKSQFYTSSTAGRGPAGYEKYLAQGPNQSEFELARFDSRAGGGLGDSPVDRLPLLAHDQQQFQQPQIQRNRTPSPLPPPHSMGTLPAYQYGQNFDNSSQTSLPPRYPPGAPPYPQQAQPTMYDQREAVLHRPSPPTNGNLAGRGAHRT